MPAETLATATKQIQEKSEHLTPLELGAHHLSGPNNEEFLLIGVNENHENAVRIYEEWKNEWEDELVYAGSGPMDDAPEVTVHEYRDPNTSPNNKNNPETN